MTAQRLGPQGLRNLLKGTTDEQRALARELMAPYLATFQAAADEQSRRDFDTRERICQTCGTTERLHSSAEFGGMSGPCLTFKPQLATPLPPMALAAANEIMENHDGTDGKYVRAGIATIIARHVQPLAEAIAQLVERAQRMAALLEESKDNHDTKCAISSGAERCTCGAAEWDKKVDEVLK